MSETPNGIGGLWGYSPLIRSGGQACCRTSVEGVEDPRTSTGMSNSGVGVRALRKLYGPLNVSLSTPFRGTSFGPFHLLPGRPLSRVRSPGPIAMRQMSSDVGGFRQQGDAGRPAFTVERRRVRLLVVCGRCGRRRVGDGEVASGAGDAIVRAGRGDAADVHGGSRA